jgi:hypothetical protein
MGICRDPVEEDSNSRLHINERKKRGQGGAYSANIISSNMAKKESKKGIQKRFGQTVGVPVE